MIYNTIILIALRRVKDGIMCVRTCTACLSLR